MTFSIDGNRGKPSLILHIAFMRQFPPRRIVCLTEETVETLYLLGEQDRIVGVSGYAVRAPGQTRKAACLRRHLGCADRRIGCDRRSVVALRRCTRIAFRIAAVSIHL